MGQPAKSNLIQQETGLQPDKAPTQHLESLFPLFLLQTFPGTRTWAWPGLPRDLVARREDPEGRLVVL